jgi:peroxiredoxin family protein
MDKMFGMMLPQGTAKLPLSNMSMGGMGTRMMKSRMAAKNLPNLEGLLDDVIKGGAKIVACSMSMEAMGIQHEELLDGVSVGGVAEFLGDSSKSSTTLFI